MQVEHNNFWHILLDSLVKHNVAGVPRSFRKGVPLIRGGSAVASSQKGVLSMGCPSFDDGVGVGQFF